jgi:hypothetical protein
MKHPKNNGYCKNNIKADSPTGEIKDCGNLESTLLEKLVENPSNIDMINENIGQSEQFKNLTENYPKVVPSPEEKESPKTETFVRNIHSLFIKAIPELLNDPGVVKTGKLFKAAADAHGKRNPSWGGPTP